MVLGGKKSIWSLSGSEAGSLGVVVVAWRLIFPAFGLIFSEIGAQLPDLQEMAEGVYLGIVNSSVAYLGEITIQGHEQERNVPGLVHTHRWT